MSGQVKIQGCVKATRTATRKDTEGKPLVIGQVVLEFDMDGSGTKSMQDLLEMLDAEVFAVISNVQFNLPGVKK